MTINNDLVSPPMMTGSVDWRSMYMDLARNLAGALCRDPDQFLVDYGTETMLHEVAGLAGSAQNNVDLTTRMFALEAVVAGVVTRLEGILEIPTALPHTLSACARDLRAALKEANLKEGEEP